MFTKLLIANRGAIAVRIIRTLKKMGIQSVVVYAESDADSLHVSMADEAYSLGEGAAAATYLNQQKIIDIAKQSGAEAIHPGYGFLSENADFCRLCDSEDIVFLGPQPNNMEAFGLKHRARELAENSEVPLLPGSELLTDLQEARRVAETVGYPVMLKSTAGGGGIGMSRCDSDQELIDAFESVRRLGESNFSNNGVFIEKFIARARHIEVQVFGDGEGGAVALGERDCSAQRRNQKVIEETPAPNLTAEVREALALAATQLVADNHYRSAGTVEFILDQDTSEFYFLEVNTRLQVEHGVTEAVYGVDLVSWMILLGAGELPALETLSHSVKAKGHAVQARVYAEDPNKQFQPSAGLLSEVVWPEQEEGLRVDHWIEAGVEVPASFDPMLAKVIVHAEDRVTAIEKLANALDQTSIYGIETNVAYTRSVLGSTAFQRGEMTTRWLNDFDYQPSTIDVLQGGTQTTIQDYPGRKGYWDIGIPPSGPFDSVSFRLANQLLGNDENAAAIEITLQGPRLKFNSSVFIAMAGAQTDGQIIRADGSIESLPFWQVIALAAGDTLVTGKVMDAGARCYMAISGGIECPLYMGSRSTFTLGQFGGHGGRALQTGDVLHFREAAVTSGEQGESKVLTEEQTPAISNSWELRVIYGPHGAPDFFTPEDIDTFFSSDWEVHYNSSRTGIRLIGPKPTWARSDGGEAGMHPSNIHDNAYAFGTVDFTGDMPVILGPDGPSLGGFVCPATVITADLWKLGQLKAGDKIRFVAVDINEAVKIESQQQKDIKALSFSDNFKLDYAAADSCVIKELPEKLGDKGQLLPKVVYRPQGDHFLLVEYGELKLDIALRFRAHALMLWLKENTLPGISELTPGIRSLQIHYDSQVLSLKKLLEHLESAEDYLDHDDDPRVPARIVHLPLSWDDKACHEAVQKYIQSVRKDAPWCPSNIEFIRRINGLDSIEQVKEIVFDANYLVLGLGDVYLGAPVATPIDPRHRLVTTKYNPARTWTAENSVGIGGSYMCIYGMEGPGGYQFVGRTLQMWNRYRKTQEFTQPWLLRFFDQIRFYPVSEDEIEKIRVDFPKGNYPIKIEETTFSLNEYQQFVESNKSDIDEFTSQRDQAFDEELQRWVESGQINFESDIPEIIDNDQVELPKGGEFIDSPVSGSLWQWHIDEGQEVEAGQLVAVVESMKMEIEITAPVDGKIHQCLKQAGDSIMAGRPIAIVATQN